MSSNKKFTVTEDDLETLLKLFQKFNVDNIWCGLTSTEEFTARRFPLGFINDITACEMTDEAWQRLSPNKQYQVKHKCLVVKVMSKNMWIEIDRLELAVINAIVAQNGISPELLYISEDCIVNAFVEGRSYGYEDDCDDEMVRKLAQTLAKVHSLRSMPISNGGYQRWLEMAKNPEENEISKPYTVDKVHLVELEKNEEFKKKYYDLIAKIDSIKEWEEFEELFQKLQSPLVFCHNDFNRGNMIVNTDQNGSKRIYLVDFDYSNFNSRGRDFGSYFSNFRHKENLFGNEGFPTDQEMEVFLEAYRQEMAENHPKPSEWLADPNNSIEQLRDESKIFAMQSYSSDAFFGLIMFTENPTTEQFLIITKTRREGYERLKKMFTEDGTIARILARKLD